MSLYGVIGYIMQTTPYKETLVPHLVATLIYLSEMYSYYIRGDRSPLGSRNTRYSINVVCYINLFSAGTVFRRQNLTSEDGLCMH